MEDSDSVAVARVNAGDGNAYRTLVDRYARQVFRLAYRMTGNEQDSEDIVQETFLRAYRQIGRFEARSGFGTWLFRIAVNCGTDLLRSRGRFPGAGAEADSSVSREPGPDRLFESGQMGRCVAGALDALTPRERAAFVLRHFEGQSIEQIGEVLGLSPNAAKHCVFRAVRKLRRALEPWVDRVHAS